MVLAFDVWLLVTVDELELEVFCLAVLLLLFEEELVLLFEFVLLELPAVELALVELLVAFEFELVELFKGFELVKFVELVELVVFVGLVEFVEFAAVGIDVELGLTTGLLFFLF